MSHWTSQAVLNLKSERSTRLKSGDDEVYSLMKTCLLGFSEEESCLDTGITFCSFGPDWFAVKFLTDIQAPMRMTPSDFDHPLDLFSHVPGIFVVSNDTFLQCG